MAISGIGVAALSAGALLIYAGLSDINPLEALKQIASGSPKAVDTGSHATPSGLGKASGSTALDIIDDVVNSGVGPLSGLAAVAYSKYGKDIYSQGKRGQEGYSDCSSFVSKAMRSYVPGFPLMVTGGFLFNPDWTTISDKSARAGDVVVNGAHMVIIGGRNSYGVLYGVGQQRSGRNVQIDSIKNLMTGTGTFLIRRYKKKNLSLAPGGN
jgi:hypothetical protein